MKILVLTLLLFLSFPLFCQENIFSYENSLRYAQYLFKTGQYATASSELERITFMNPPNDSVKFLLIESYRKDKNYPRGIKRNEDFYPDAAHMPGNFSITHSQMLLLNREYEKLKNFIELNKNLSEKQKFFFRLNSSLFEKEWENARQTWNTSDSSFKSTFPGYDKLLAEIPAGKYKSPALATGLSIILPGSGKFYTKNWVDGLLSFVTIGALSFQAYRGFSSKGINSSYGWVFGSLAFGFYSGNVYGSYKAAKAYNSNLDKKFAENVEKEFDRFF
jgi:hypothetical protein